MGQEISQSSFTPDDLARFKCSLDQETQLARDTFARGGFAEQGAHIGFELEAWLLDRNFYPKPCNQSFLARMNDPMVVAELSRFNIELNGPPQALNGHALSRLERQLEGTWLRCLDNARADEATAIAIGTLPTLREADLTLSTMTPSRRYAALNRQMIKSRGGEPIALDIEGLPGSGQRLRTPPHDDMMLEAATTSFQLHLQVPASRISAYMNASMMLSGPLLSLSANSPFLFGHTLWHETRIPLFEQAVDGGIEKTLPERVGFGAGYLGQDPTSYFVDNAERFAPLLPACCQADCREFAHLRLHNGTIWRWNRLLIGFDHAHAPHLRIEQRVMPAGPSVIDMMANAAFYYGAVHMLAQQSGATAMLPFERAHDSFYAAARHGLDAQLPWLDGGTHDAVALLDKMLPMVREGLQDLRIDAGDIDRYLDVLAVRLRTRRNGASWQRAHHAAHGDFFRLTADYLAHQRSGMPVHEWPV